MMHLTILIRYSECLKLFYKDEPTLQSLTSKFYMQTIRKCSTDLQLFEISEPVELLFSHSVIFSYNSAHSRCELEE